MGSFLVKMWVFDPLGFPCIWVTHHCFAINLEEISSCYVLNVYLWLLWTIKWSKREVIWITSIFEVTFGQNVGIWAPGVSMYRVTPHCYAINFEGIPSYFVLMYICGYSALSNGPNREVRWIIPILGVIFWLKYGYLTT